MPRAIWSGHITFGLVSIPVALHSAVESSERVHFRQLHRKDLSPIRYKKFCSKEDREVPNSEIVRGYEVSKNKYAVVEEDELDEVQAEVGEGDRTIDIVQFVDFGSLNPLLFEKPYYVAPVKGGEKAYGVLRDALQETRKAGVARFYMRTRPLLAALTPTGNVLALEVMRMVSELRDPKKLSVKTVAARSNEVKMASTLIDQMTGEWDPTEHPNRYRKALEKLIAKKPKFDVEKAAAEERPKGGKVVDLMQALKDSLESGRRKPARSKPARKKTGRKKAA
ncbi:MAG TPA: Ku protein [Candidatus Binatia bacterium]